MPGSRASSAAWRNSLGRLMLRQREAGWAGARSVLPQSIMLHESNPFGRHCECFPHDPRASLIEEPRQPAGNGRFRVSPGRGRQCRFGRKEIDKLQWGRRK